MSQLRLQKRDDPLAINLTEDATQLAAEREAQPERVANRQTHGAQPTAPARRRATRRRTPTRAATPAPTPAATATGDPASERSYDADRLEQTGWRMYESLLADVRARANELTAAGIPTSSAALAAATLHSHLPRTIDEGTEVMRAYRQATAGRTRRSR
jgi:hypothetical protein